MQALLKAQINKTDRNDARGMAQMMRVGLYRPVHVKTLRSQKLRMLLTHRKLLQSKAIAIENDLRGTLRNFGLKVGMAGTVKFETRIKELVGNSPELAALVEPLLVVRRVLREQLVILHRRLLAIVRDDEVCQRPPGACEDVRQPEAADAADPSQTVAVEGDRHRERPARYVVDFRLKVGMAGTVKFETRIKELVGNAPDLAALVEPLLVVRRVLREQLVILHCRSPAIVRDDEVCQRLMTTPEHRALHRRWNDVPRGTMG